ncbi:MAG: coenzyme F420-0:L-glutamate ligase [Candidatus Lokiarchaeota archaeon]|nr:coenzyme F420-0:L-glutamate ligase [Candidatus Lokiarchaeota archaeon]MBD3201244.1 coenzyme F420-0:L-glutamate ligase [Candidatus Lokiarchaeota archaeon]
MTPNIELIGLKGIPLIKRGDDIGEIILKAFTNNNIILQSQDIICIAQTIISKSLGLIKNLNQITPSDKAVKLYKKMKDKSNEKNIPIKEPELIQQILEESSEILRSEHVLITETKHGFICANAGIDKSNVGEENLLSVLPENADEDAYKIRKKIKESTGKDVAIIITDSFGRPFRIGAVGVAIGVSGINPVLDKRGSKDLFGKELKSTIIGQIDNLSSAAQLIMGESDEGLPVVLIRGYKFERNENSKINHILRKKENDLFRTFNIHNQFDEILRTRRSYKEEFANTLVSMKTIRECIKNARWAPNAHNSQPWKLIIIKRQIREKLINEMNKKLKSDLLNDNKSEGYINSKISKTRESFLNAPYLLLLCLDQNLLQNYPDEERQSNELLLGVQSISAFATYFLLALEIRGLAACWYSAPLFSGDIVRKTLNIPESFIPMAFFTVGYPKKKISPSKRKNIEDILFKI